MGISSSHPQNIHRLNIELILIVNFLGFNQITPLKTCFSAMTRHGDDVVALSKNLWGKT